MGRILAQVRLLQSITWWQGLLFDDDERSYLAGADCGQHKLVSDRRMGSVPHWLHGISYFDFVFPLDSPEDQLAAIPLLRPNRYFLSVRAHFSSVRIWSVNPPWTVYKSAEFLADVVVVAAVVATLQSVEEYRNFVNWTWVLLGVLVASAGRARQ